MMSQKLSKKLCSDMVFFSADDLKSANNPMREKKRRAEFQTQIDKLFN